MCKDLYILDSILKLNLIVTIWRFFFAKSKEKIWLYWMTNYVRFFLRKFLFKKMAQQENYFFWEKISPQIKKKIYLIIFLKNKGRSHKETKYLSKIKSIKLFLFWSLKWETKSSKLNIWSSEMIKSYSHSKALRADSNLFIQ